MVSPLAKLLFYSIAMLTIPVGGFFTSKSFVYEGTDCHLCYSSVILILIILTKILYRMCLCVFYLLYLYVWLGIFGMEDGSVAAAITAVVLVHCVIAGYVYEAWKEEPSPDPMIFKKQD